VAATSSALTALARWPLLMPCIRQTMSRSFPRRLTTDRYRRNLTVDP
jgi:hypothetical protein